jgi:hypothetical protein
VKIGKDKKEKKNYYEEDRYEKSKGRECKRVTASAFVQTKFIFT